MKVTKEESIYSIRFTFKESEVEHFNVDCYNPQLLINEPLPVHIWKSIEEIVDQKYQPIGYSLVHNMSTGDNEVNGIVYLLKI